jgi:RNA polymerase sigma factor (sigma-70 family)
MKTRSSANQTPTARPHSLPASADAPTPGDRSRTYAGVEPDDATLAAACLRGESRAWAALVQRYQRLVHAIVRRVGLDEHMAADVFQTVFARLLRHLPRIADPSRLQAWIVTTAKREALLQRQRGERTVSIDAECEDGSRVWDFADSAPLAEDALDDLQQLHHVRLALDQLDARCRRLLEMLFNDDDTPLAYDVMARSLDMAVGSIGPTRARCLGKLRQSLSSQTR